MKGERLTVNDDMLKENKNLSVEDKLFLTQFKVFTQPHIKLKDKNICRKCEAKPCVFVCPAKNYKKVDGIVEFSWEGCLECGSCRIVCKNGGIDWKYPQGGFGVKYRYG